MRTVRSIRFPVTPALALVTALAVAFALALAVTPAAHADTAPPTSATPTTVSSDSLPAPQINGVVWDQQIVGNTVFAGGNFTTARPAGSAAGVGTVSRTYLLSYNLSTGALNSWAPVLNGQVDAIDASPDGSRIYVVGAFTTVNGVGANRIVAFDTTTGAVVSSFAAGANAEVFAVAASATTVYFSGNFNQAKGVARPGRAAAASASTGDTTGWAPVLGSGRAYGIIVSPDASRVVIGGNFTTLNGSDNPGYGLGAVDPTTGGSLAFPLNSSVRNAGTDSAIFSLSNDGDSFSGTGYIFGTGGNLEGTFRSDWAGNLIWVEDCHGDTYGSVAVNDVVYTASHAHYCGNIGGSPQLNPLRHDHAVAFSKAATGTITRDILGYPSWTGTASPTELNWFPTMNEGSFTGQSQGPWDVTGNSQYVVYGGEFTAVNGAGQQGIARFAVPSIAPNKDGPQVSGANWPISVTSSSSGTATITWPSTYDRDNSQLSYRIVRDGNLASPIATLSGSSTWWDRPGMAYIDRGLAPGSTHTYRIHAVDPFGNASDSSTVSVTIASTGTLSAYAQGVLSSGPTWYYRLGDSGTTATNSAGPVANVNQGSGTQVVNATVGSGATRGRPGAIAGDPNGATRFNGSSSSRAYTSASTWVDDSMTVETWFSTTAASGKIVGFGTSSNASNSGTVDRHLYLNGGRVTWGVFDTANRTLQSGTGYNDGTWHYAVGTIGPAGQFLYVDGALVASTTSVVKGGRYWGYWHIGGDTTWAGSTDFTGDIDEVAIYDTVLSGATIAQHYQLGKGGGTPNSPPVAAFTSSTANLTATVNGSSSSDSDGTIAGYAWTYGDGSSATGATPAAHTYAAAGTYTVTLTVTDNLGATSSVSHPVTVAGANTPPVAAFSSSISGLTASVDGTGSTDANGTVTAWAWAFGDGATATGATAVHTYAAAGTYTVSLTVTDNQGATNTVAHPVTVTAAAPGTLVASDDFNRTVSGGWGSAATGGAWTASVPTASSVGSGVGAFSHAVGTTRRAVLNGTSVADVDITAQVATNKVTSVGHIVAGVVARQVSSSTYYQARARFLPSGVLALQITQGSGSTLVANATVTGVTYAAGDQFNIRFQVSGSSPTTLKAKIWKVGTTEPTTWLLTATDSTAGLQTAGALAVESYISSSATNAPVTVTFDNYTATRLGAAPANQPPVAAFSSSVSNLTASVNGSASTDDGTITGYAWSFGDGGSGSGVNTSHLYAAAGTYTVTLTVTDNQGATNSVSHPVTVTAPAPGSVIAQDDFNRTVTGGWGSAPTGGAWTVSSAANSAVSSGVGSLTHAVGATRRAVLNATSVADVDITAQVATNKVASAGHIVVGVVARQVSTTDYYQARARFLPSGVLGLQITQGSASTVLANSNNVGISYAAGDQFNIRFQVSGTNPTTLKAKIWKVGTTEPTSWLLTATDSTATLQGPGALAVESYISSSATNAPVTVSYDNYTATRLG